MASKLPEDASLSESEGESLALRIKKKRARRVSFADTEITSVHIFRRDDDCETPPDSNSGPPAAASTAADNEVLGFFRDLGGDSEDSGDEDRGSVDGRKSFLRPTGSPSPGGSSTAGSAASNDEDNFFGPVSSSFIRPGRFSDSGVSDEIHEETLDTTAFSLHYRSLARSDSGEVKTPTAVRLVFEEKTASKDNNPTDTGCSMALTEPKKVMSESSIPRVKMRSGEDSDNMSMVDENPKSYDYGMISPTLDALLEESSKDLNSNSVSVPISSKSPIGNEALTYGQNGASHTDDRQSGDPEPGYLDAHEKSADDDFISNILCENNVGSVDLISSGFLSERNNGQTPSAFDHEPGRENQLISGSEIFIEETTPGKIMSRLEVPSTHDGSQQNVGGNVLKTVVGPRHESVSQNLNKSPVRKTSLVKETHITDNVRNPVQQLVSSPYTLLSSAGRPSVLNTPSSARGSDMVPSYLRHENLQSNECMKHDESISKLKVRDNSYSGSSIKQATDKLKHRLSKYSSLSSPVGSTLQNSREFKSKYASTSVAGLQGQLSNADQKNDKDRSLVRLDMNRVETPRSTSKLGQNEATVLVKDGDSLQSMSIDALSNDKRDKLATPLLSTFNLMSPRIKMMWDTLISEDSMKTMVLTSMTDFGLINSKEFNIPRLHFESGTVKCAQSPRDKGNLNVKSESSERNLQTVMNMPLSTSTSSHNKDSTQIHFGKVLTQDPHGETPSEKVASVKELMDISSRINPTQSSPKLLPTRSPFMKKATSRSPMKVPAHTSPGNDATQIFPRKEPLQSPLVKELTWSPGTKADENSFRKEQIQSPSRLNQSSATRRSSTASVRQGVVSSRSTADQMHISESPNVRKRGSTAVVLEDGERTHKSPKIRRSPRFLKSGNNDSGILPEQIVTNFNEKDKSNHNPPPQHWLDIFQKFSWDAGHLLSPSINVLNSESIGSLEDIISYFLEVKNYEMLHSEIQSQKAADQLSGVHKKRIADTRLLLCKIAHEKAKLKMRSEEHDKLLQKVQLLKSGIRECQMLKSNFILQSKIARRDTQLDDYQRQSCSANLDGEPQVASDTIDTKKHEIKTLDRKINNLSNLFQQHCKMNGEPSYADTLASIQDHLLKRKCRSLIRQDLQLWKVNAFENQNGQYSILLNYRGYLSQRFTLTSAPVSSIIISNQLNDINILKNFPNMNALVAFAFVCNAEVSKRGVKSKCLAQVTQVTQSLLRNLLDVIEEVQMAQIEIGNLVQTNFHCPSGQELNLHLYFINFHSGEKVTLTLDVTCLSSGTYPSDILPCDIRIPLVRTQKFTLLIDEVRSASETLEVGYSRITRLCRSVSQLLQDKRSLTT